MKISLGYTLGEDINSFRRLFNLYYPPLCIYAKRYIKDDATCEDIVQEAFAQLWAKKEKIVITCSIRNYLVRTVRNLCIDYIRTNSSYRKYMEWYKESDEPKTGLSPDEIYTRAELEKMLDNALGRLPDAYRTVFEMNRFEKMTYDEISKTLGISVRTAKRYRSNAEQTIIKELKKNISK